MHATLFDRLCAKLDDASVDYRVTRHAAVFTSEEAAEVRGASLSSGAKALICKANDAFLMLVIPADRKLDSKRVRKAYGMRGLRFANVDEVQQLTGLRPGSIPPFGSLFDLPTWCDGALAAETHINFNAADHCISINMPYADYVRVESPQLAAISASPG